MSSQLTALLAAILWLQATAVPTGNHTCTGVVKHPVTVLVNVTEPVTFRSYTWCLRVPPRCSKYTVQLKDRVKLHVEMHNKTITVCCEGYVEMEGRCVPACPTGADCPFMRCNRTNHCHCTPGYTGLYCNEACPRGLWGKDCKRPCDCPSGYTCHHLTGDCFVDDRPPRRTTTPTTTTTTTIRATTTITTPTTEGTTFETVKTPVFRFPPPPWVESATDTKKTTTRQIKKDEAPPTKEMGVSKETSEMTNLKRYTGKNLIENPLSPLTTERVSNKIDVERPTTVQQFHSLSNEEELYNKKMINGSTNIEDSERKQKFPLNSLPLTTPSKSTEKPMFQNNHGSLTQSGFTFSKELITPVPTSLTSEMKNTLKLQIDTTNTPFQINVTPNLQHITQTMPMDTLVVETSTNSAYTKFNYTTTSKLNNITEKSPTKATQLPTIHKLMQDTTPEENTLEYKIQKQMFTSSVNPTIETTENNTIHINNSRLEPNSSTDPRFLVPFIKLSSTIEPTTKATENSDVKRPTLTNQHRSTIPVYFSSTNSNYMEEKQLIALSENVTLPVILKTENTSLSSASNSTTIPFTLKTLLSLTPMSSTKSNIPFNPSSGIPNQKEIGVFSVLTSTKQPTTYDNTIFKNTAIYHLSPSLNSTSAAPITSTTTAIPTTVKSLIIPPTIELLTIPDITTSSSLTSTNTIIPPTITRTATAGTTSTAQPFIFSATNPFTSITEPTTIDTFKTEIPTTKTKIMTSTFTVSNEISEKEYNYDTIKSKITETQPITVTIPISATDIFKDIKKQKLDDAQSSYSVPDKPKKKHEKIKPKTMNTKEFPSVYQIKTEKYNETKMQLTTEISLKSILHAETFRNNVLSTKSPRPPKIQPLPGFRNKSFDTDESAALKNTNDAPTTTKPNQSILGILKEPSEISGSSLVSTEKNSVLESNTIDYRQSSEETIKKVMAQEEETNYSLIFNKIKFNMTESIAAGVKASRDDNSYFHLPMILVLGIALVTLLLLTLTLWVYLKRRREHEEPFSPCIMAYAIEEPPPMDFESFDPAFFCPTFSNNYAERINRELRELNYDHPRSSTQEPLYAEIFT